MQITAHNTRQLNGTALLPSSKSECLRGIFFATLANGRSHLHNILDSEDIDDAIRVARCLGAEISSDGNTLQVKSKGLPLPVRSENIYTGNSGLTLRFVLPLLGFRAEPTQRLTLDCSDQMRARPIRPLIEAVSRLGLQVEYLDKEGCCPISLSGTLRGGDTEVDGVSCSQYLSALLIALPCAEHDSVITVYHLHERPYVELTLHWLRELGIQHQHQRFADSDTFQISGRQRYASFTRNISGDFSSASYFIAAAALLPGEVLLRGLDMQHPQGDKKLVNILQDMGADISIHPGYLHIRGGKPLRGMAIDANDTPDLLPTLAVIATQTTNTTRIYNVAHARGKETDRIHSMAVGLRAMGAEVNTADDGLTIQPSRLHGASVEGFGDHRTVMALSVAGLLTDSGVTTISDAEAINKTFPGFVELMQSLGAGIASTPSPLVGEGAR